MFVVVNIPTFPTTKKPLTEIRDFDDQIINNTKFLVCKSDEFLVVVVAYFALVVEDHGSTLLVE